MDNVSFSDPVMQEEIFGPILPIITFKDIEEVESELFDYKDGVYYYKKSSNL